MAPTLIDLFSGCGGLGLGFHQAGFSTTYANEIHVDPATTYVRNLLDDESHRMLLGPIEQQLSNKAIDMRRSELRDIDCLSGGPMSRTLIAGAGNPTTPKYAVS